MVSSTKRYVCSVLSISDYLFYILVKENFPAPMERVLFSITIPRTFLPLNYWPFITTVLDSLKTLPPSRLFHPISIHFLRWHHIHVWYPRHTYIYLFIYLLIHLFISAGTQRYLFLLWVIIHYCFVLLLILSQLWTLGALLIGPCLPLTFLPQRVWVFVLVWVVSIFQSNMQKD